MKYVGFATPHVLPLTHNWDVAFVVAYIDETEADLRKLIGADLGPLPAGGDFFRSLLTWLHYRTRSIPQQPRNVISSPEVDAKRPLYPAVDDITRELRKGGDLKPWLSESIRKKKANPKADLMFNDWQVTHFHLGRVFVTPGKIKRTDDLLFAFIAADHAVLLEIQPHGSWGMKNLLRILLRVRPSDMRNEFKGDLVLAYNPTEEEYVKLRTAGVASPIEIDGRYFMPPSLGIASSGDAVRLVTRLRRSLADLCRCLAANDLPSDLLRTLTSNLALPVRIGVRIDGGRLIAYDKNRKRDLMILQSLE